MPARSETPEPAVQTTQRSLKLSQRELRSLIEWVRATIDLQSDRVNGGVLDHEIINQLREFLADLDSTALSVEDIRYSGIDRALRNICGSRTMWPADLVEMANQALQVLEVKVGPPRRVKVKNLQASGHHSPGKVIQGGLVTKVDRRIKNHDSLRAYEAGHNGFEVGDWWDEAAHASQKGIIDGSQDGITSDENGAYAVVLGKDQEINSGEPDMVEYIASNTEDGRFRLMENMRSCVCIRVLRSWRSNSKWAPRGGIRYDGLYRVVGFGIKLIIEQTDEWIYTFKLSREEGQPRLDTALRRPTAEEYENWKMAWEARNGITAPSSPLSVGTERTFTFRLENEMKKPEEGDEGYFSRAAKHGK